jgi:hypothetical protein
MPRPATSTPSPRASGEQQRRSRQLIDLEGELETALTSGLRSAAAPAALATASAISALRWSDPAVEQAARKRAETLTEAAPPSPDVCADVRAWAASGFQTLSQASKERVAALRARAQAAAGAQSRLTLAELVERLGDSSSRRLLAELDRAGTKLSLALGPIEAAHGEVLKALGVPQNPRFQPPLVSEPSGTVVGRGRTAVGGKFTAEVSRGPGCHERLTISEDGGFTGECLSKANPITARPAVQCLQGLLTVTLVTSGAARRAILELASGRRIESHLIAIPRRRGGPLGFYYQVVKGPSPIPVSLTVLDGSGRVLREVALPARRNCVEQTFSYLPGGRPHAVLSGALPGGPAYEVDTARYRADGNVHLEVTILTESESPTFIEAATGVRPQIIGVPIGPDRPPTLSLERTTGCEPQEFEILAGVLRAPGDEALAVTSAGLLPLSKLALPAALHAHGVLVYGAFTTGVAKVLVRDPAGRTVFTEPLGASTTELGEECEGEREPPGAG